uniref:FLYWCH-type domain-containing protein n=1 Tax=Panagrellus redivivus TaxID=6233 RepID=A0A7E4ZSL2_PANRE
MNPYPFKPLDHSVAAFVDARRFQNLLWHGYAYNFKHKHDEGVSYRCCRSTRRLYCPATATVDNEGNVEMKRTHIHEPQYIQNEVAYMKHQFLSFVFGAPSCHVDDVIIAAASILSPHQQGMAKILLHNEYLKWLGRDQLIKVCGGEVSKKKKKASGVPARLFGTKSLFTLIDFAEHVQSENDRYPLDDLDADFEMEVDT